MPINRRQFIATLGATPAQELAATEARWGETVPFPVDTSAYLARHDVVYQSPPTAGWEALPIGNGDLSAMVWTGESTLRLQINKCDTWDKPDAEAPKLLRSCGRLSIDFAAPCFDWLYLDNFEARLSLGAAAARFSATSPFAKVSATARAHAQRNVLILDCVADWTGELSASGSTPRISLERWGSRSFHNWYSSIRRGASEGLGRAKSGAAGRDMWLVETLAGLTFAVACRVTGTPAEASVVHAHRSDIRIASAKQHRFSVLIAVVTSEESLEPLKAAIGLLDSCEQAGSDALRVEHEQWWSSFWRQSFVHIGHDYLENLYYLHMYLMGCASRGRYPAVFNAATFTWNHDVRQWATPHHWNMQQAYWSLCAANHPALLRPYLDTYWRLSPHAETHAKARGTTDAILWSEPHDYDGGMSFWKRNDMLNNFTPASQIAQFFWQYFQHTGDQQFLRSRAYPFMKKAAEFYVQYLKWDEAKKEYFIFPSQPYEYPDGNQFRNPLTDLAMIRASFKSCLKASRILGADPEKRAQWERVLKHLAPYRYTTLPTGGEAVATVEDANGKPVDLGSSEYGFCRGTSPVFPAGEVGLQQKGSRLFEAMMRRARLHPKNVLAIHPIATVKARLGMAEESMQDLIMSVRQLQHFPQGLFYNIDHWHYLSRYTDIAKNPIVACQRDYVFDRSTRYRNLKARGSDQRVDTPTEPFIQCGLETSAILAVTINEMLLQSHEGIIRVFPSTPRDWPAAFTLCARGAFIVSSERDRNAPPGFVAVKSLAGNPCKIANPWPGQGVVLRDPISGGKVPFNVAGDAITFETALNRVYLLTPVDAGSAMPSLARFESQPNPGPKRLDEAILGKPRDF
jgi:hypothetical protein